MHIKVFCFNPFYENTYVIYSDKGNCWIIDPGCSDVQEEAQLVSFLESYNLVPVRLLLTHAHIDHILGCSFLLEKYGLKPEMHKGELETLRSGIMVSKFYGIDYKPVPDPNVFLEENDVLELDGETWECILAPGHSPASICFFSKARGVLIAGDVLFEGSIGRTDLPGGDYNTLINSIRKKLFPLGNHVVVYPGHGGITTIGQEILTNPFLS